ncbi:MAG: tetratricopeptide repeat protein [Phycisphaerales bacterium]
MHTRNHFRAIVAASILAATGSIAGASMHLDTPTMQEAQSHLQQQDWDSAIAAYRAIIKEQPSNANAHFLLGYALHASGDLDNAILQHKKAAKMPQVAGPASYNLGCAYALKGETDDAFETLRVAIDMGVRDISQFKNDPDLASLREDERWTPMLKSIKSLSDAETALHFWVGEWDCYITPTGQLGGNNTLSFRVGNKVIHESWTSAGGQFAGESWNVYNRETNRWEQTWVDISGARLFITAKCNDDSVEGLMFEGENVRPGADPQRTRMHVRPVDDGRVLQTGYASDDGGKTWTQKYEFLYVPKGEAYSPGES